MEEDDDNFLDGVIEFGDGRQYKIESADLPTDLSSTTLPTAESTDSMPSQPRSRSRSRSRPDDARPSSNVPVSKEERFADDFDRSWPRSRASPSVSTRDLPSGAALSTHSSSSAAAPSPVSPVISLAHGHPPQDSSASRALLFNERSNKLEPYNRAAGNAASGQKRGGDGFPSSSPTDTRGREFPSVQGNNNNVQLLQNRGRGFSGGGFNNERQQPRRDGMPAPPVTTPQLSPRMPVNPWTQKKDAEGPEAAGRRLSAMGPPPVPPPHAGLGTAGGRQRPPHLPLVPSEADGLPARPQRRPSTSRESRLPPPTVEPPSSARAPSQSPSLSHTSAVAQSPVVPAPQLSGPDLDEVRKDLMQSAAARAKARRQQEEEEREKAQERARLKAAEIEEKIRAAEAEKTKAKEAEQAAQAQVILPLISVAAIFINASSRMSWISSRQPSRV